MNDLTVLAYPFIFAAIYFEAFLLVTLLSAPARKVRERAVSSRTPLVAMVVPCYNEESTVAGTVQSLLALDYPSDKLRVILVDDGSTDGTGAVMDRFSTHPQVTVIHQENKGKHEALNAGIAAAPEAELIGCLDADSFVEPSALREMIASFDEPSVGAATAAMSIHEPKNVLEHTQNAEYILGIALRHILAAVNGLYVTPGPFSLYRRELVVLLGGFNHGHNAEDMEMALRLQRAGYAIASAHNARVYTKAPRTVPALVKQRTRWTTGFLRNVLNEYRDMVGNPRFGALGLLVLPLGFSAIIGGIGLFFLAVYEITRRAIEALVLASGVPLSYTLSSLIPDFSSLSWSSLPITLTLLLSLIALIGSVAFMIIGKQVSRTPANLGAGILAYLLVYALVAPFWLIRSVADVAIGHKRSWR